MKLSRDEFCELVSEALDTLPDGFRQQLNNVEVVVEDLPPPEFEGRFRGSLLGLYQGVPLNRRSWSSLRLPDKISIYQQNIERICRTREEIRQQVRQTVLHEIGHHFGMNEREIRGAGY